MTNFNFKVIPTALHADFRPYEMRSVMLEPDDTGPVI